MAQTKEYRKNWYRNNKDKTSAYLKRYRLKYPWKVAKNHISYRCAHSPNYCKRKDLISVEELKTLWFRDKAYLLKKPSIHRIDNDGDYTFDNCRFIELSENLLLGVLGRRLSKESRKKISIGVTKKYCLRGHLLEGDNLRYTKVGRVCKSCSRMHSRNWAKKHYKKRGVQDVEPK